MNIPGKLQKIRQDLREIAYYDDWDDEIEDFEGPSEGKHDYVLFHLDKKFGNERDLLKKMKRMGIILRSNKFYAKLVTEPRPKRSWWHAEFIAKDNLENFFGFFGIWDYDWEIDVENAIYVEDNPHKYGRWNPPRKLK